MAAVMKVWVVRDENDKDPWLYLIGEGADGRLEWTHDSQMHFATPKPPECRPAVISRKGCILESKESANVLPAEAEILTGLYMPAAMDRLRELVHES